MTQRGLTTYYVLLITQAVSSLGSSISSFAVGIWLFKHTGHATPLTLVSFFFVLAQVLVPTVGGMLADHMDRRRVMLIAEVGMALSSTLLLISFASGGFQVWHLYTLTFTQAGFAALQAPAFQASITMLVPDTHRDRANAAQFIAGPAASILGPAVSGVLYVVIGVTGAIVVDIATFVAAAIVLLIVRIPPPPKSDAVPDGGAVAQVLSGFRYLMDRRPLLAFGAFFAAVNFLAVLGLGLLTPYTLGRANDPAMLGFVLGLFNVGAVAGGALMAVWGGTRPRIHTIMLGLLLGSVAIVLTGVARAPMAIAASLFVFGLTGPMINAPFMSIMQAKVAPDVQGRVFGALGQVSSLLTPLAYLIAGPLADHVFEPARSLAAWHWVAPLVGSGKGAGIGLMLVLTGTVLIVLCLAVYAARPIRTLEATLPDQG